MPLEIRHFQLVAAIADTGSLAAASRKLHLTPSALSHQLRDAEERTRVRLFHRRHRRLLLTGAGERLVESARRVLADVAHAEAALDGEAPEEVIRLSTGCYTAYTWLPPVFGTWQAEYPRVEVRIVLEATRQPTGALLAGELDLALTTDAPRDARLKQARLFADELLLVVPAGHRFARRRHVGATELAEEHVLTYDAPREQLDIFTRVFWPAGLEPRRVSRVPLTEALIELVRGGIGVTPLASWVLPTRREGLAVVRLAPGGLSRQWSAVTLAARRPQPSLTRFVQLLREHVPTREPSGPRR